MGSTREGRDEAADEATSLIQKMYDWAIVQAQSKYATSVLAVIAFLESSIFPIPPDVMLVPMCLADRRRAFLFGAICTIASVIGGIAGYYIGYALIDSLGTWIVKTYGLQSRLDQFQAQIQEYGVWIILVKGLTPIPYKLVTIACGAGKMNLFDFIWASALTRGVRFMTEATLLWWFGPPIRNFIEKRLTVLTWVFLIALIGGFIVIRYM